MLVKIYAADDDGQQPRPASPYVNDDGSVLDISTPKDSQISVISLSEASTPFQRQSPRQRRSPTPDNLPDIDPFY